MKYNFAVIVPMANEEKEFEIFTSTLINVLDKLESGKVYFIQFPKKADKISL